MTLDSIQTLLITLTFVVPGFVIQSVFSLFTLRRKEEKELLFLRFLAFSTLNFVCCLWIIRLLLLHNYVAHRPFVAMLWFFAVNFVSPLIIGVIIGLFDQKQIVHWALHKISSCKVFKAFSLVPLSPTPSAWEYKFEAIVNEIFNDNDENKKDENKNRKNKGRWVYVKLDDGSYVHGWFSGKGFASTDTGERDLYIDFAYDLDEKNRWVLRKRSDGILIKADTIKSVEFFQPEK